MSHALEQLSAQQGKLPPKLPGEIGGLFGGLVNKLVRTQGPLCLFTAISTLLWIPDSSCSDRTAHTCAVHVALRWSEYSSQIPMLLYHKT